LKGLPKKVRNQGFDDFTSNAVLNSLPIALKPRLISSIVNRSGVHCLSMLFVAWSTRILTFSYIIAMAVGSELPAFLIRLFPT